MKWSYDYVEFVDSYVIKQNGRVRLYVNIEDNAICICNALNCDYESEVYVRYDTKEENYSVDKES